MSSSRRARSKRKVKQQSRQNDRKVLRLGTRMRTVDLEGAEEKRRLVLPPFSYRGKTF